MPCFRCAIGCLVLAGCAVAAARAQSPEKVPPSPFLPSNYGSAPPPAESNSALDTLEMRGVMTIEGKTFVSIYDKSNSKSFTIELNTTSETGVKVSDYNQADDTVLVESGGHSRRVQLIKPTIIAAAPATAAPVAIGVPNRPAPAVPGQIQQMSDDEVRQRMQRVAEEIRRRRAMRRQMLQNAQRQSQD